MTNIPKLLEHLFLVSWSPLFPCDPDSSIPDHSLVLAEVRVSIAELDGAILGGVGQQEEGVMLGLGGGGEVDLVSAPSADVDLGHGVRQGDTMIMTTYLVSRCQHIGGSVKRLLIGSGHQEGKQHTLNMGIRMG